MLTHNRIQQFLGHDEHETYEHWYDRGGEDADLGIPSQLCPSMSDTAMSGYEAGFIDAIIEGANLT